MAQIAALFDMDKTLLDESSAFLYAQYLYRIGRFRRRDLVQVAWWGALGRLGLLDMHTLVPRLLAEAVGDDEAELRRMCDRWFAEDVVPHITARGQQQVDAHRRQGHRVAIVSGSTQYAVRPLAEYLGIPGQYLCTHLESEEGRLTGQLTLPVCYGTGKIVWVDRFAEAHNVDLSASWFYTDSVSDLPLLERVGHPVAVNPDPRLRRLARRRDWPIQMFY